MKRFFIGIMLIVGVFSYESLIRFIYTEKNTYNQVDIEVQKKIKFGHPLKGIFYSAMEIQYSLDYEYPKSILENETIVFKLKLLESRYKLPALTLLGIQKSTNLEDRIIEDQYLFRTINISLVSAAFEIEPKGMIELEKGTKLPIEMTWSITSKLKGEHSLVLNLSDLIEKKDEQNIIKTTTIINGDKSRNINYKQIVLPIHVKTIWGVDETTVTILKFLVIFLAFVLMYPLFLGFIKRKFNIPNE